MEPPATVQSKAATAIEHRIAGPHEDIRPPYPAPPERSTVRHDDLAIISPMRLLVLVLFVLAAGCGDETTPPEPDATTDLDASGGTDAASTDAALDAPDDGSTGADARADDGGAPTGGLVGWASVSGLGVDTTTGGGDVAPTVVTTLSELEAAVDGTAAAVVRIEGSVEGNVSVGSNKTLEGAPGATFRGSLILDASVNVILRNLTIVGYDCSDNADCGSGRDAITVIDGAHHIWFDHCDISDGSDGNLDITRESDFITVSWTRFSYSGRRSGGHQLSNLVGASDSHTDDAGHLNITWHHNWWADNVQERMPRVRFGKNHLFNNLYRSTGNNYCVGLGVSGDVLLESNVFDGVRNPINSTSYSDSNSVVESRGNLYTDITGDTADFGSGVFVPPYPYTLDDVNEVEALVRAGVGP